MENFDVPLVPEQPEVVPKEGDVIAITVPVKKVKKLKKQHISDERKEELKKIRCEALKKGRESAAAKRKAKKEASMEIAATSHPTPAVALPIIEESNEIAKLKPKVKKSEITNDELIDLKVEKKLLEKERIQMNNDRNKLENEITSLRRQLKEKDEKKSESPYLDETSNKIAKTVKIIEEPIPKIQKEGKKKFNTKDKKFNKKRVFGF
tara:strand:- start:84 stop:707 length:624 start_codon:yes stop_codon:yes gene_type:complete